MQNVYSMELESPRGTATLRIRLYHVPLNLLLPGLIEHVLTIGKGNRMRHTPGFYRRLPMVLIESDVVRAAVALLVMGFLAAGSYSLWFVLVLPIFVYLGLWLITSTEKPAFWPRGKRTDYQSCLKHRHQMALLAEQVSDAQTASQITTITAQLDRILQAIDEDKKYDSTTLLLSLIGITKDYLEDYLKVMRRGFDEEGTHVDVSKNLALLSARYHSFWEQLNRPVVVDLVALGETIQELFEQLEFPDPELQVTKSPLNQPDAADPVPARPGTPSNQGFSPSMNGHINTARLTRREAEVLCLLVKAKTDQQIAEELYIARRTVTTHNREIFTKLGVDSRTAAAIYAVHHGLCPDNAVV